MQIVVPGSGRRYLDGDSLDQGAPLVFSVPEVLTVAECEEMIARIEVLGPQAAPVTTASGFVMMPDVRNNTRVMFDDVALAAELFRRLGAALPAQVCGRRPVGVNERFRCYRYAPGQRFASHFDGSYQRSATECSELTLMVYLNEGFGEGSTAFLDFDVQVRPRAGAALMFQHRLLHEGTTVTSGTKYVLRSDVMYAD
ncbi:MAG TPA: 2OG-Fe(II) oxygenase [Kofleriaceae bacterium]|jgi:predicted 2-oxoglutarate/Fe(II)-dependent dioxygenase YbiX|nr:2OG-Fe(II) oxygenase [Kofleriaceae bacterium]